jgi:ubiquinone/menaquinone biosynthesis C-methylase UbiE
MRARALDNPAYRFDRDAAFYEDISARRRDELQGCTWLDVGAGTGCVDAYLADMLNPESFDLCDLNVGPRTAYPVSRFDGTHLDHPEDSYDVLFFTYVLHHAADSTIPLLRDAHRIARRYVVVLEDPKETPDDHLWAYKHDERGTFRGLAEWRELFGLLDFSIVHDEALGDEIHSRHYFLLSPA